MLMMLVKASVAHAFAADFSKQDSLEIEGISILGNNKTKERIILRELDFKTGDRIAASELDTLLKINRDHIFNLHLFLEVHLESRLIEKGKIHIIIVVKERWFTLPSFNIELADRNINEWWTVYHRDLKRILYTTALTQQNCRGRNETFMAALQFGYSNYLLLLYDIPSIDKNSKHGLSFTSQFLRNREIAYDTDASNRLLYYRSEDIIRKRQQYSLTYKYRPAIKNIHLFDLSFHNNIIADTISLLNPYYLPNTNNMSFITFSYSFNRNNTDIHYYPNKGYSLSLSLRHLGLGLSRDISSFDMTTSFAWYKELSKKLFAATSLNARINSSKEQHFLYAPNHGYEGNFVRSYEF